MEKLIAILIATLLTAVIVGSFWTGCKLARMETDNPSGKVARFSRWLDRHWWKAGIVLLWYIFYIGFSS